MEKICVTTELLDNQAQTIQQLLGELERIADEVQAVGGKLRWNVAISDNICRALSVQSNSITALEQKAGLMKNALLSASSSYTATESRLCNRESGQGNQKNVDGGNSTTTSTESSKSWWEKLKDQAEDTLESIGNDIKSGFAKAVDIAKDTVSYYYQNYQDKGLVYKTIQTGKAVVATAGAVGSILALWGLTAGTAGVSTPLACIGTAYAANTIANSFADVYNCWWGDVEKIGDTNILKTGLEYGGGKIGEMLGSKEIGETAGSILYTAGGVTTIVANISALAGQIRQAPDLAKSISGATGEAKSFANGAWDIAVHSDLSSVAYDWKLLGYTVPNITDVQVCYSLLKTVAEDTKSVAEAGYGIIGDILDCVQRVGKVTP